MITTRKTIEANSVPADPSRPLAGVAPFRVIAGRGIVDAHGRLIATCRSESVMASDGYMVRDRALGFNPMQSDSNTHAVACALNIAAMAAPGEYRAEGREMVGHGWDSGAQAWDVIRDKGEQWVCLSDPLHTPAVVRALNRDNAERASDALIEKARNVYGSDEIEIDDDARTSSSGEDGDAGVWVSAWVWIADEATAERDPNASPRVGDTLPLNASRLCWPEPQGDGRQCRFNVMVGRDAQRLARDCAARVALPVHVVPENVTGAIVQTKNGDYVEVWLTDAWQPVDMATAVYTCVLAPDGEA